jgi:ribosomal protein S18 acetylase RimI-like enzyme
MIVPHRPFPAARCLPEATGSAGPVGHDAHMIGQVVIRDGGPDDVPRMGWASSDGLRAQWLAQAHRAATGESDFLVAEYAGKVVGKVVVDWVHNPDGSAWLWMGSVDPAYRGQGIGQKALAAAEDRARQRGRHVVEMCVDDDNPRARDLYLRSGYTIVGPYLDEHDETGPDGNPVRVASPGVLLRKPL